MNRAAPTTGSTPQALISCHRWKKRHVDWETHRREHRKWLVVFIIHFHLFQIYQSENFSTSMSGTAMGEREQQEDRKVLGNPFSTKPGAQIGIIFTHAHAQIYTLKRQLSCLFSFLVHSPITFPLGCLHLLVDQYKQCAKSEYKPSVSQMCTYFFSCSVTCSFSIS